MFKLDLKKRSILIMLFALFSTFYSRAQLTINTQPVKLQRICVPSMPTTPRLQVAAVTCSGATLTYQWQRLRPTSIGGSGTFDDISTSWPGYTGANTPTLDITVADSISGIRSTYKYRCYIVSSFPCYGTATTNVAEIVGVRKPVVKYLTQQDTNVCESYSGSDSKYPLRARIIGVSKRDSLQYTWRFLDRNASNVDGPVSAHPNYTGWISTWNQTPDTTTLLNNITLNQANSTTILLNNDLNRYYLLVSSPACGLIDTNTVEKRRLFVNPVPNLTVNAPNPLNICKNGTATISYTISNALRSAARGSTAINWTIDNANITVGTGGNVLKNLIQANPLDTGNVGNVTRTITVPSGWATGTHKVNITGIRNYSVPANAISCTRTLSSADITVNVYPNPRLTLLVPLADTAICQGTSGVLKFKVDSATFGVGGSNVAWTVAVSYSNGTLITPSTLLSGVGNQVVTVNIPNSLGVGAHQITLTGIATTGTPSTCTGTTYGTVSRTFNVYPSPNATLNTTATDNICAGGAPASFTYTVSNTSGNSWKLYYSDATLSGLPGSPISGTGDLTSATFTTGALAGNASYVIKLDSIRLDPSPPAPVTLCTRVLTGQSKTVNVYNTPSATLSAVYGNTCQGSTPASVTMNVSNAIFNASNLAWTITTNGTFRAPTDSTSSASTALTSVFATTGSGNAAYAFTPPSNLAPGRYVININAIGLTNTPGCSNPLTLKYTLDIWPKPSAAIFGASMTGNMCEGDVVNYSIAIGNSYYFAGGNQGYNLIYSSTLGTNPPTTGAIPAVGSIAGSGNGVLGAYTTDNTLTTGIYNVTLATITNTTHGCVMTLTGDTANSTKLLRRIYPKPVATASVPSVDLCEGTAGTFDVTVTNAQRYGITGVSADSMTWTLSTTGTFQAAPSGSVSVTTMSGITFPTAGKGNDTTTVTLPNTLAAGRYTFTLGNPTLASSPSCVGTAAPNSVITVNVYPRPTMTITPLVDTTCQDVQKSYTVAIGNNYFEPTFTAVLTDYLYSNTTGAGTAPSYANTTSTISPTVTGNNSTTYNTAAIGTPGRYYFKIYDVFNSTHNCYYDTSNYPNPNGVGAYITEALDSFVLIVKQRPRLSVVSTAPTEVCFNTGAVVTYTVDSVAAGQAWSFTYTASPVTPSGAATISGVGPVTNATFTTSPFTTAGAGTITFTSIGLTAGGGCASLLVDTTININVAGTPDVTSTVTSGPAQICGNANPTDMTTNWDVTVANMVVGSVTKNWTITYDIVGTEDTSAASGTQSYLKSNLTYTGSGNGTFTITTPNQTYNGTSADAGIFDTRSINITKIETTGPNAAPPGANCSNSSVTDNTTTFVVKPRPRFEFTAPSNVFTGSHLGHVCVTSPVVRGYNVWGLKAGESGSLLWNGTNPTSSSNTENFSGPSVISQSITTNNTINPGFAIITVTNVTNSTTGCAILASPAIKADSTIVDPPSNTTNLTPSFTVCEGNNSGTLKLTGKVIGLVTKWQYSENDGFTWLDFANTDTFYSFTNASLTRRWKVIVKHKMCPADTSNEQIVFVHPQPKVQIATFSSGICQNDSVRFTLTVTGVPTNHDWKMGYTKAGFTAGNGSATLIGKGSGTFSYSYGGMTASAGTGTIQLNTINNDTTNCSNTYTSSGSHLMTIVIGNQSTAGTISLVSPFAGTLNQTVCQGSNVKLSYTGSGSVSWWYNSKSTSGSFPSGWDSTYNPSNNFTYGSIDSTTQFRVRVKFGSCASVTNTSNQTVLVRKLATATISGSDTICENNTATLNVSINGEPNATVSLGWLEGSTGKSGSFSLGSNPPSTTTPTTITTSNLTTTTSVILQSLQYTSGSPACPVNLYTNAIATVTVNPKPNVTINNVTTPVCINSTSTVNYTLTGLASTTTWKLTYKVGSTVLTATGTGSGTYNLTTPTLATAGTTVVEMVSIETTNLRTNCTSGVLSGITLSIQVDAATTPGTVASDVTICKGGSATVTLTPGNGTITKWNTSTSGASGSYSSVSSTSNILNLTNITTNTWITATSKNGVCAEATTVTPVAITVRELPVATIAGSTTICSGTTATLTINISNEYGQPWSITYLEGTATKTVTGSGTTTTITTSALTTNTDVTLQTITLTGTASSTNPLCSNTISSTVTVNVNVLPTVTLNSVGGPICSGSSTTYDVTVSNVPTGQGWSLTGTINNGTAVVSITGAAGTGSGTFTFNTPTLTNTATSPSVGLPVTLTLITNTTTGCTSGTISLSKDVTVFVPTVGGTASTAQTVCKGTNSGSVSVSGQTGSVVRWEYLPTGSSTWTSVTNTTTTLNFTNLTATTQYRAVIKNGPCSEANSTDVTITVNELPTVTIAIPSANNPICQYTNGTYTITVGNTYGQAWAVKVMEGASARTLTGTGNGIFTFTSSSTFSSNTVISLQDIATTAGVTCGPNTQSGDVTFTVTPRPSVTLNSVTTPVCQGTSTFATFSITTSNLASGVGFDVTYSIGSTTGLHYTNTGSGTFTVTTTTPALNSPGSITVTLTDITTTGLTPNCNSTPASQTKNITVDATSVAGTVISDVTVCKGTNSGSLSVSGHNGTVVRWEYLPSGSSTWTVVSNTTTSLTFTNLTKTTKYRVYTRNNTCSEIVSTNEVTVTVNELPTVTIAIPSANNPICQYTNGTYTITVGNTYGQAWAVKVMEGASARTLTGTGDGTFTFTSTSTFSSNTVISLQDIATTAGVTCGPNTQSGDVTFTVTPRPSVTLNSVTTPVCQGTSTFATFQITTSNIASGVGFSVTYNVGSTTGLTYTNTGSGTFTVATSTPALTTAGTTAVTLTDITTTGLTPNCNSTPSGQTMNITVDATSVSGTVSSNQTVCKGTNSGSVSVSGQTGSVVRWEYSTNSGASWTAVSNTTTSLSFSNLTVTTQYRAFIKNSSCAEVTQSTPVTITVNELPTVTIAIPSANNPICQYTNGTYTITVGNTYTQAWAVKVMEGASARTLTGTGDGTFTFTSSSTFSSNTVISLQDIATTAGVTCGPNTQSGDVTFTVTPLPNATLIITNTPICQGSASSFDFTVSNIATGQAWSMSYTEGGTAKTTTGNGPGTYNKATSVLNTPGNVIVTLNSITITSTTPNCTRTLTGQTDTIVVDATTVAGSVSGKATVCKGSNSGSLTYSGGNGAIVRWEFSINGGATWSATGTTSSTYSYSNLTQTTNYRVVVKNSSCATATSAPDTITLREQPNATISGSGTICQGTTTTLIVSVSNSFGNPWSITYLEGTNTKTFTGSGDGNKTLTTGTLTSTSDITLQSISLTHAGTTTNPACGPNTLTSTATVNVTPLPTATLNAVVSPVCQGSTSSFEFTVSNLSTGQGWSMSYTEGSTSKTTAGNGPGTYTVNTSALSAGTVTITLNSITTTGLTPNCSRTLTGQSLDITVNPTTTVGTLGTDVTVCKNSNSGNLTYVVGGSNGAVVRWESSVISASGPWTAITNTTNSQQYINISQTTYYRVIVKSGTCAEKESNVITISVQEIPVATIGGSTTICAGNTATLSVSISNVAAGQRSTLNYLEGTTSKSITIFGASGTITTSVLNSNTDITLVSLSSVDSTISSTFRKGCSNSTLTSTATVNVNALPTVTLSSVGGPICQGNSTTYTVTVTNVPTGQGWNLTGTIEGVSISPVPSGTGSGTFTFNTTVLNTPGNAVVSFTLITNSTTGCTRTVSETKSIRVDATTTVGTSTGDATVCKLSNAGSATYTAGSGNGKIVRWEYSTVSPTSNFIGITNNSATQTYSNLTATTYYRAIVKNGECAEVASNVVTITVRDLPSATIASSQTICENSSANFTISVTNTFGQTFRVYYMIGSKRDSLEKTGDGTYTLNTGTLSSSISVTLLSIKQISGSPQCNQMLTGLINITVNELPKATYTTLPNSVCQGNKITFTFDVSKVKTTQNWTLSYNVKAPSSGSAVNESTSGSGSGSFTISTTATVLPTTSTLTLGTITNTTTGCSSTLNDAKVITVDPTTVGGTVSSSATVCKGTNSGTLALTGNTGAVVRWESSINGGSTWTTINNSTSALTYSNLTQTTLYRAFVQSGVCSGANSSSVTITVNELPTATVTNTTICAGNAANLSVVVTNTYGQSWSLTFVEGSTTRTLSGTGDGTFTLTTNVLTATTVVSLKSIQISSGSVLCSNTLTGVGVVTVNALPTASHDSAPSSVCDGSPVDFTVNVDDVVAGQGWTINYRINSGSINTRSGTGPGNFSITTPNFANSTTAMRVDTIKIVSITNTTTGCVRTATLTRTLEVYPKSLGGTTASTVNPLCANTATTSDITVTGLVGKVIRWEYSDDNQSTWTTLSNLNTTITVSNLSKTREYRAVVQSGPCSISNSTVTKITVIPTVEAVITGAPQICAGKTANFNVLVSNIASTDNWSLTYRVNGVVQTAMTGKGPGNYPLSVGAPTTNLAGVIVVKLESITNTTYGCANNALSTQAIATVNPNPIAGFTFVNSCKDSVAVFTNTSSISTGTIADFNWNFGNGSFSKNGNPTQAYTATGNYPVSLLAISALGCRDSITRTITVNPRPTANFTFKNTCQDTAVKFTDGSSIATGGSIVSRFWNFGDGSTLAGNTSNPSRSYAAAGTYTVTLTVVSNNGCASTIVRNVTVYTLPEPNYVANPVCQNSAMTFINTSSIGVGAMTYKWDFAGQGNSTLSNPSHTFTGFGLFNVSLTATSNQGCVKTLTKSVQIWANPVANFTVADVCIGETSRFINTSAMPSGSTDNVQENFWSFGDSTFSTGKDPLHTYAKDGIYSVIVRATSNKGCINSITKTAVVHPLPVVTITTPKSKFCDGDNSILTANAGMRQYEWSLGGVVLGTNQTFTATKQGWYKVKIWAPSTLGGCSNEDSIFITVWPLPTADAGRDTIIDKGQSVILNGKGAGLGGSYNWSPATYLSNATIARPTCKPDETILYTLTVIDRNGCIDTDSVDITVKAEFVLIVHNVITPLNPDGLNDTWIIDNIEAYPTAEVAVFNRYGMEVFKVKGYKNQWDGTDKLTGGNDLPDGAYYYVITMEGTDKVYKGAISLVRGKR